MLLVLLSGRKCKIVRRCCCSWRCSIVKSHRPWWPNWTYLIGQGWGQLRWEAGEAGQTQGIITDRLSCCHRSHEFGSEGHTWIGKSYIWMFTYDYIYQCNGPSVVNQRPEVPSWLSKCWLLNLRFAGQLICPYLLQCMKKYVESTQKSVN